MHVLSQTVRLPACFSNLPWSTLVGLRLNGETAGVDWKYPMLNHSMSNTIVKYSWITLPETNIGAENRPSQKESSLPTIHFWVRTFSFREGTSLVLKTSQLLQDNLSNSHRRVSKSQQSSSPWQSRLGKTRKTWRASSRRWGSDLGWYPEVLQNG